MRPIHSPIVFFCFPIITIIGTLLSKYYETVSLKYLVWFLLLVCILIMQGRLNVQKNTIRLLLPLLPVVLAVVASQCITPVSFFMGTSYSIGFASLLLSLILLLQSINSLNELRHAVKYYIVGLITSGTILSLPYLFTGSIMPGGMYFNPNEFGERISLIYDSNLNFPFLTGLLFLLATETLVNNLLSGNLRSVIFAGIILICAIILFILVLSTNRRNVMLAIALTLASLRMKRWGAIMLIIPCVMPFVWSPIGGAIIRNVDYLGGDKVIVRVTEEDIYSANKRDFVWNYAKDRLENPDSIMDFLFGNKEDLGNMMTELWSDDPRIWILYHAHNSMLQFFVEFGLVGLAAYVICYLYLMLLVFRLLTIANNTKWFTAQNNVLICGLYYCAFCGGAESLMRLDASEWIIWLVFWMFIIRTATILEPKAVAQYQRGFGDIEAIP